MIDRDQALSLVQEQNPEQHLVFHALQSEAVMRGLAEEFGEDQELWGIVGLTHDVDFPHTKDDPDKHGLMAMDILAGSLPEEGLNAIKAHNAEHTGFEPQTRLDFALRCAESATGLVSANAKVRPGGMDGMKPKSLKKKMKEKAFAANVDRDRIRECEKIGLDLGRFFEIAIQSMAKTPQELGLI